MTDLKIALDLDDTLLGFNIAYNNYFGVDISVQSSHTITKNVQKLRCNKKFWENLELIERPDFEPHIYATKRISSKVYTRNNLLKVGLPIKPIYQTVIQAGNKANIIKGRCDILIDDSIFNVKQAISKGLPALLIDRPHNHLDNFPYRIYNLKLDEIRQAYETQIVEWNYVRYKFNLI